MTTFIDPSWKHIVTIAGVPPSWNKNTIEYHLDSMFKSKPQIRCKSYISDLQIYKKQNEDINDLVSDQQYCFELRFETKLARDLFSNYLNGKTVDNRYKIYCERRDLPSDDIYENNNNNNGTTIISNFDTTITKKRKLKPLTIDVTEILPTGFTIKWTFSDRDSDIKNKYAHLEVVNKALDKTKTFRKLENELKFNFICSDKYETDFTIRGRVIHDEDDLYEYSDWNSSSLITSPLAKEYSKHNVYSNTSNLYVNNSIVVNELDNKYNQLYPGWFFNTYVSQNQQNNQQNQNQQNPQQRQQPNLTQQQWLEKYHEHQKKYQQIWSTVSGVVHDSGYIPQNPYGYSSFEQNRPYYNNNPTYTPTYTSYGNNMRYNQNINNNYYNTYNSYNQFNAPGKVPTSLRPPTSIYVQHFHRKPESLLIQWKDDSNYRLKRDVDYTYTLEVTNISINSRPKLFYNIKENQFKFQCDPNKDTIYSVKVKCAAVVENNVRTIGDSTWSNTYRFRSPSKDNYNPNVRSYNNSNNFRSSNNNNHNNHNSNNNNTNNSGTYYYRQKQVKTNNYNDGLHTVG